MSAFCVGWQYISCDWSMAPYNEAKGEGYFCDNWYSFCHSSQAPGEASFSPQLWCILVKLLGERAAKPSRHPTLNTNLTYRDVRCYSLHSWKPLQGHLKLSWRSLRTQGKHAWMTHMSLASLQPNKKNLLGQHPSPANRKAAQWCGPESWKNSQTRQATTVPCPHHSIPQPQPKDQKEFKWNNMQM